MIEKHVYGGVEVYTLAYQRVNEDLTPRQAERNAVAELVRAAFGSEAVLAHYDDGAPYVPGSERFISVSHSRTLAALAVAGFPIGIDIEEPRPQLERIARRFLSPEEQRHYRTMPELLTAWTLKEAAYKALRPSAPATEMPLPPVSLPYAVIHTGSFLRHTISLVRSV